MHSPRTLGASLVLPRLAAAFLSLLGLQACGANPPLWSDEPAGELLVEISPPASRQAGSDPSGVLVIEIREPSRRRTWTDSVHLDPGKTATISFGSLPEGGNYQVIGRLRDGSGLTTHADTAWPVAITAGTKASVPLVLAPLLGRITVVLPGVPVEVDSIEASWSGTLLAQRAVAVARGTGGRTLLRLDSLPVGDRGTLRLRAGNHLGDTLFSLDTTLAIQTQSERSLSLTLRSNSSSLSISVSTSAAADLRSVARFPQEETPRGPLRILALSDSGQSDWIALENQGADTARGPWRLVHGSESLEIPVAVPPGGKVLATRATCASALPARALQDARWQVACGLELAVAWTSTSTSWELRGPDDSLSDQVVAFDGQAGWPALNASSARTLRRRGDTSGMDPLDGASWCALASGLPDIPCP